MKLKTLRLLYHCLKTQPETVTVPRAFYRQMAELAWCATRQPCLFDQYGAPHFVLQKGLDFADAAMDIAEGREN